MLDIVSRSFLDIQLPNHIDFDIYNHCTLRVSRGMLNLCVVKQIGLNNYMVGAWGLKEYENHSASKNTLHVHVVHPSIGYLILVCNAKNGNVVVDNVIGLIAKWDHNGMIKYQLSDVSSYDYNLVMLKETLLYCNVFFQCNA